MPYRFEISPSARAGCQNKDCKDNKIKIAKGELRVGSWVDTDKVQYWAWRHWGCTTPKVFENIVKSLQDDDDDDNVDKSNLNYDHLDGFDDLSSEFQEKIKTALEKGHVEDEEWNGDVTHNRPGMIGMHPRKRKVKEDSKNPSPKEADPATAENDETAKANGEASNKGDAETANDAPAEAKKSSAKRKKPTPAEDTTNEKAADDDVHDDEKPAPKRKRSARAKKDETEAEVEADSKETTKTKGREGSSKGASKNGRAKKTAKEEEPEEKVAVEEESVAKDVPKKGRAKRTAKDKNAEAKVADKDEDAEEKPVANMGKPKRGRPRAAKKQV